jgi:hypothetical protein
MAQADDQDTPPDRIWVLLGDYIALAGEQLVRWGLDRGRLPCRYRDAWDNLRPGNSLPGGYWLDCEINCKEHSAKRRERVIPRSGFDNYFARFKTLPPEYGAGRATTPPNSAPPPTQDRVIPALEIYCVELLVPYAGEKPVVEPAPPTPLEPKDWLFAEVDRRKLADDIPTGAKAVTKLSKELADQMVKDFQAGKCTRALPAKTIRTRLYEYKLWSN